MTGLQCTEEPLGYRHVMFVQRTSIVTTYIYTYIKFGLDIYV